MNDFKQRYENIKFWRKRMVICVVLVFNGVLVKFFPNMINWMIDSLFWWNKDIGVLIVFTLFGIGPFAGAWFFIMGWSAISELEVRCGKCNNKFTLEELEAMGDSFHCPYCLHDSIKQPVPRTQEDINRDAERMVGRILRHMDKK